MHWLCEGTFSQGSSLSDDDDFQCLCCQSLDSETSSWDYFVAKSNENSECQRKLELDTVKSKCKSKSKCEALKEWVDSNIGDYEYQLLETLDRNRMI